MLAGPQNQEIGSRRLVNVTLSNGNAAHFLKRRKYRLGDYSCWLTRQSSANLSPTEIPANREINREICEFGWDAKHAVANLGANS